MKYRTTPNNVVIFESKVQHIQEKKKLLCRTYIVKVLEKRNHHMEIDIHDNFGIYCRDYEIVNGNISVNTKIGPQILGSTTPTSY